MLSVSDLVAVPSPAYPPTMKSTKIFSFPLDVENLAVSSVNPLTVSVSCCVVGRTVGIDVYHGFSAIANSGCLIVPRPIAVEMYPAPSLPTSCVH